VIIGIAQLERLKLARVLPYLLVLFLIFWAWFATADEPRPGAVNAQSQEKVARILQAVLQHYWESGDGTNAPGTNWVANYTNVETAFREASKLMPERMDLRFGIASLLISQALQTNGPALEIKVAEALRAYQEIWALDTNSFDAPILYAAYARAIGETNASNATLDSVMRLYPQRATEYLSKFRLVDLLFEKPPLEALGNIMPRDKRHAIVILGAGLETNGTIKSKLSSRLHQGLKLARTYKAAPIILTGGNQKSGVTEAYVMARWLLNCGISKKRLYLEDQSKDTVGNAAFSSLILQSLGVTHVTLVTSNSHMRRALTDFQEACFQRGLKLQYDCAPVKTSEADLDQEQERVGVYRDLLRSSGIWSFPGIQR
jgi:uncharacterized SAM-binding protein YcdF (DUF218 family)